MFSFLQRTKKILGRETRGRCGRRHPRCPLVRFELLPFHCWKLRGTADSRQTKDWSPASWRLKSIWFAQFILIKFEIGMVFAGSPGFSKHLMHYPLTPAASFSFAFLPKTNFDLDDSKRNRLSVFCSRSFIDGDSLKGDNEFVIKVTWHTGTALASPKLKHFSFM